MKEEEKQIKRPNEPVKQPVAVVKREGVTRSPKPVKPPVEASKPVKRAVTATPKPKKRKKPKKEIPSPGDEFRKALIQLAPTALGIIGGAVFGDSSEDVRLGATIGDSASQLLQGYQNVEINKQLAEDQKAADEQNAQIARDNQAIQLQGQQLDQFNKNRDYELDRLKLNFDAANTDVERAKIQAEIDNLQAKTDMAVKEADVYGKYADASKQAEINQRNAAALKSQVDAGTALVDPDTGTPTAFNKERNTWVNAAGEKTKAGIPQSAYAAKTRATGERGAKAGEFTTPDGRPVKQMEDGSFSDFAGNPVDASQIVVKQVAAKRALNPTQEILNKTKVSKINKEIGQIQKNYELEQERVYQSSAAGKAEASSTDKFVKEYEQYQKDLPNTQASLEKLKKAYAIIAQPSNLQSTWTTLIDIVDAKVLPRTMPDIARAKQLAYGAVQAQLRQTLGSQFTEEEGKRIFGFTYDPILGDEDNLTTLNNALNAGLQRMFYFDKKGEYLETHGSLKGFKASSINKSPEYKAILGYMGGNMPHYKKQELQKEQDIERFTPLMNELFGEGN